VTLWARALAARQPNPILDDPAAIALTERLRPHLAPETDEFHQQLVADRLPALLTVTMALRAQYFDQKARDFLLRFPRAVVVNLGAGLDTRFERLDASPQPIGGRVRVVDLDLPPMIALKRTLCAPHPRHELRAASVLDHAWMDALDRYDDRRLIFLAEGLLMYLPPAEVKQLVVAMAQRFPGSELVAEVVSKTWLRPPWSKLAARKLQRQLHFDRAAIFQFGLDAPAVMAQWHPLIHFLDDWSFLDAHERKLGWMRALRHLPFVRHIQYVVRYQFG
jgi:methyltransferase (TIGR00027 family)